MPFTSLDSRMQQVAAATLTHLRQKYGNQGLRVEQDIDSSIGWRPTISVRPNSSLIVAVEVADNLYPEILKIAAFDIEKYPMPIAVYQACSLAAYQSDTKQTKIHQLQKNGFGIITVDDDGLCSIQRSAVPLAQHISQEVFDQSILSLTPSLKVQFRIAYETYQTNIGQGLQAAGQIVEGIVIAIATQGKKKGLSVNPKNKPATVIDELYQTPSLANHRARLGAARTFLSEFRNAASHPANSAKKSLIKMQKCRKGFLDAADTAVKLMTSAKELGYTIKVHTT